MGDRYVVAGLARPRTEWFTRIGRWATEATIPVEFVRCVSIAELRSRLDSGRPFSAAIIAGDVAGLDRDLLQRVRDAGAAPLVVDDGSGRDWISLGAASVVRPDVDRDVLVDTLSSTSNLVDDVHSTRSSSGWDSHTGPAGTLVAVTGPGGTGASTAAAALAQGLAVEGRDVVLADLRRVAEQAMLHDARTVVPGLQELVDAHRVDQPDRDTVRGLTFSVDPRGYRLLLGLRRPRQWTVLRPTALETSLVGLRRAFDLVVADVDADVEGEPETGSVDVEERHLASRSTLSRADAVLVVGAPGVKGLYSLARLTGELLDFGVPPARLLTVVNRAPRSRRARAEHARTLADLLQGQLGGDRLATPLFLPERRVEEAARDGVALPSPLPEQLAGAITALLQQQPTRLTDTTPVPVPITPGSLGIAGHDDEEDVA